MVRNYDSPDPKLVIANLRKVLANADMSQLSKGAYDFLNLHCGFIAHYNHAGFIGVYRDDMPSFVDGFLSQLGMGWSTFLENQHSYLYDVSYRGVLVADIIRQLIPIFEGAKGRLERLHEARERQRKLVALQSLAAELGYNVAPKETTTQERR